MSTSIDPTSRAARGVTRTLVDVKTSRLVPGRAIVLAASVAAFVALAGCHSKNTASTPEQPCREDVGDDIESAGRTGVEGVKTGATTAVEGVKTFGSATAGFVEGGKKEAKERWNDGAAQTSQTAEQGADKTRQQGLPRCKK